MSDGKERREEGPGSDAAATPVVSDVEPALEAEKASSAEQEGESAVVAEERDTGLDAGESVAPSDQDAPDAEQAAHAPDEAGDDSAAEQSTQGPEQAAEPRPEEASLAAMRLVEVDGAEGIRDAKRALGELEALLDEFENPNRSKESSAGLGSMHSGVITQSDLDRRLEEVAAAVSSASSKSGTKAPADAAKGGKGGMIAGIIGALALLLSLVALVQQSGLSERLEAQPGAQASSGGTREEVARLRMEFRQLTEKVNELSVMMEDAGHQAGEGGRVGMAAFEARLARLEGRLSNESGEVEASVPAVEENAAVVTEPKPAAGGHWVINLTSFTNEQVAQQEVDRLRDHGIPAEKQRAVTDGKVWYRLRITGLPTYERAKAYIDELKGKADTSSAWIAKE